MTVLDEILEGKRAELAAAQRAVAPGAMEQSARARAAAEPTRGLRAALLRAEPPAVIAELKRRSPSRGEIRPDFDAVKCARAYAEGGAAALSVLTDARWFGGSLELLDRVRREVELPLLRKDFLLDPYQIDESRARGADAVLLIARALAPELLARLLARARSLGLDALVEVHDEAELDAALAAGADLIGVNNRDLRSFEVDLGTTERLAARVPPGRGILLVAESGIFTNHDVRRLERAGARAFLVGEALMREPELADALRRLRRRT